MSHSLENEKNCQQPPTKRQRTLPEATTGESSSLASSPLGLASSRAMSPPCLERDNHDSSSLSAPKIRDPPESGPIFTDVQELCLCSNIESALGVPTRILFRCVGGDQKKSKISTSSSNNHLAENGKTQEKENRRRLRPLLSRQEAEQFLRLTLVAQEIDVLVDLSETVLSRRHFARRFRRNVLMMQHKSTLAQTEERPWRNPWLSTLGPILDVLEQRRPDPSSFLRKNRASNDEQVDGQMLISQDNILKHIHNQLTRLYHELQACGIYELERSAEQNRSLVISLTDILDYHYDDDAQHDKNNDDGGRTFAVRDLAKEKLSLSKLQDLIAKRVRSLLVVLCHSRDNASVETNDSFEDVAVSGNDVDCNDNIGKGRKRILFDDDSPLTSADGMAEDIGNKKKFPTRKPGSHDEVDEDEANGGDESSTLPLEKILVPLEIVCEKLFPRDDRSTLTESMATAVRIEKSKKDSKNVSNKSKFERAPVVTKQTQNKESQRQDRSDNESSSPNAATMLSTRNPFIPTGSMLENSDPMRMITTEASQRTVGVADIMMGLAKTTKEDAFAQTKKAPAMDCTVENDSESLSVDISASQRTFGAASTMMALATKATENFTTPTDNQRMTKFDNTNRKGEGFFGDATNRNDALTKLQDDNDDNDAHDDSSFVEDPPEDGEDAMGETTQEGKTAGFQDKAKNDDVGIFDVVDILTPQSQIMEKGQSP